MSTEHSLMLLTRAACRDMQPILCHLDIQQPEQPPDASHPHTGSSSMDNGQLTLKPSTPEAVCPAPTSPLMCTTIWCKGLACLSLWAFSCNGVVRLLPAGAAGSRHPERLLLVATMVTATAAGGLQLEVSGCKLLHLHTTLLPCKLPAGCS